MSSPLGRVRPIAVQALTSTRARDARRWLVERRRRLRGEPLRVRYFHQVDDPYSQLAAQVLPRLAARYEVEIEPHLVGPPPDDAAPERARLEAFARKDAADVADAYGLAFPRVASAPPAAERERAERLLAGAIAAQRFVAAAAPIGAALWQGGATGLDAAAGGLTPAEPAAARRAVEAGTALRERLGHYLGAMLELGGEWYWGVDRLWHLERRLQALGALRAGASAAPIAPRPEISRAPVAASARRVVLEVFPSLRSPYTAIALRRTFALAERLPVQLVLRPVLPMVMRGLRVPRRKALYILLDTRREAEDAGEPFGRVQDPVGRPVERAFSLYPWARERGRAGELLLAFARAAFAEGIDLGTDAGLRSAVEAAGLAWSEARRHLDGEGWREELEANRRALLEAGLWGVPSFRVSGGAGLADFWTWGQDRLWLVDAELRRRL